MKRLLLISFIFVSGCHMRCHDYINCHPDYSHKNQALTTTPKALKDANLTVRGAVYVEELY